MSQKNSNQNPEGNNNNEDNGSAGASAANRMDSTHPHLLVETAKMLSAPETERIQHVDKEKFILHNNAKEVLGALKETFLSPIDVSRPRCLAILGASNHGKTATENRFFADYAAFASDFFPAEEEVPLVGVEMPPRPMQGAVGDSIARALGLRGMPPHTKSRVVTDNVLRALAAKKTRMIIFNEFQQVKALPASERQVVYDFVKGITNQHIHVVAVGTDAAREFLSEDEQIENRFRIVKMVPMKLGAEFQRFLGSLEAFYPLPEPSLLFSHERYIYKITGGVTGEVVNLCNTAAALAIRRGAPCIDEKLLKLAEPRPLASAA